MTETIETLNFVLALGGIATFFAGAVLLFDYFSQQSLRVLVTRYTALIATIVTGAAVALTLVYSEVFGFVPCGLCWFGRIFMYPQFLIAGTALIAKKTGFALYGLVLAVPGLLISLYHHYIQMGGSEVVGCPASGGDCAKRILFEFDFITFPLIGASLFFFLTVLYFYNLKVAGIPFFKHKE